MIHFPIEGGMFNFRVAGALLHDGCVLAHRDRRHDYYALPGGRVEPFEPTEETIAREWREEMGQPVRVERLLAVSEDFFEERGKKYHELGFYYLLSLAGEAKIPLSGTFFSTEREADGTPHLEFEWLPVAGARIEKLVPAFLRARLQDPSPYPEHIVENGL